MEDHAMAPSRRIRYADASFAAGGKSRCMPCFPLYHAARIYGFLLFNDGSRGDPWLRKPRLGVNTCEADLKRGRRVENSLVRLR